MLLLTQTAAVLLFLYHGWRAVTFPYALDYGEGPLLDQAVRLASFQNIYRADLSAPPYVIANYPPLFIAMQAPWTWLVGPAFWYGRALSLLSSIAVMVLVISIIRILTNEWVAAINGGVTLLAIPYVLYWAPLFRVDVMGLALSCAGLWLVTRWPDTTWSLVFVAVLFTAATYTRQSYGLAAPFAAFVWLLSQRLCRRAVLLVVLMALFGGGLFLLLNVSSRGGFLFNIVTANINALSLSRLQLVLGQMWQGMWYLLLGGAIFLVAGYWLQPRAWWLVGPYLLGATVTASTIAKTGSNVNYLLELSVALGFAIGLIISSQRNRPVARSALMLLLALQIALLVQWSRGSYYQSTMKKIAQRGEIERLMQVVHQSNGVVLADEHMGLVPLDGRPLYFQPFEMKQLADVGLWDQQRFVEALEQGSFAAILIYEPPGQEFKADRWTRAMLAALDKRYAPVGTVAETVIYQPNP